MSSRPFARDRARELSALRAGLAATAALSVAELVGGYFTNSLALVSSLVNLQARSMSDEAAKTALAEAQDRIFAISLVHKRLYSSGDVRTVTSDPEIGYFGAKLDDAALTPTPGAGAWIAPTTLDEWLAESR